MYSGGGFGARAHRGCAVVSSQFRSLPSAVRINSVVAVGTEVCRLGVRVFPRSISRSIPSVFHSFGSGLRYFFSLECGGGTREVRNKKTPVFCPVCEQHSLCNRAIGDHATTTRRTMVRDADPGPDACNLVSESNNFLVEMRCYVIYGLYRSNILVQSFFHIFFLLFHVYPLSTTIDPRLDPRIPTYPRVHSPRFPKRLLGGLAIDFSTERPFLLC